MSVNNILKYTPAELQAGAGHAPRVITAHRALASGITSAALLAAASWNDRKSYDERRRKARARHKAQAVALRAVAEQMEATWLDRLDRAVAIARAA